MGYLEACPPATDGGLPIPFEGPAKQKMRTFRSIDQSPPYGGSPHFARIGFAPEGEATGPPWPTGCVSVHAVLLYSRTLLGVPGKI